MSKKLCDPGRILGLLLLLVTFVMPVTASATPAPPLAKTVTVQQNQASSDFPNSIKFSLAAKLTSGSAAIKEVDLDYILLGSVATEVKVANLTTTGTGLQAETTVDTKRSYIPPGTHLSYYWEFVDTAGNIYDTSAQELVYQDHRFPFQELSKGVVTVRWYAGADSFGQAALNKALATIDRLGQEYNIKPTKPINITIYPDTQTMFTALPPNTAEWVGGQAVPTLGTIVLAIPAGNLTEVNRSIPHEVTHQVNYQATKNPYNYLPKWLDEGLAVYNQDQVDGFLIQAFQRGVDKQDLIPLRVLNGSFPADTQQSYLAYGESVEVIKYIIKKYGSAGIGRILSAFKDGVSYNEAVQKGLGIGLDELDREWRQSLGYTQPATATLTPAQVAATTSPVTSNPTTSNFETVPPGSDTSASSADPNVTATFAANAVTQAVAQLTATHPSAATPVLKTDSTLVITDNSPLVLLIGGIVMLAVGGVLVTLAVTSKRH